MKEALSNSSVLMPLVLGEAFELYIVAKENSIKCVLS